MTKKQCPLGENCDLTTAWMAGAAKAQDQIKAQAAEIERLRGDVEKMIGGAETVLEAWDSGNEASFRDAIEELRADVEEAKGGKDAQGNM